MDSTLNYGPSCRLCGRAFTGAAEETFVDLGMSPLCESYLSRNQLDEPETFYPLHVRICPACLLVQLPAYVAGEDIFSEYAYFSSYSESWVRHARRYAETVIRRRSLNAESLVVEVASNDGYLLQHFVAAGIPVVGVEPAGNVAAAARKRGVRTEVEFLGPETAARIADRYGRADLVVANNVLAHVPDLRGFAAGLAALVKPDGIVSLEFPHLLRLVEQRQYDTIYHEHYSYFSLLTASQALAGAGLTVTDVEELPSHGGSLRVWAELAGHTGPAGRTGPAEHRGSQSVERVLAAERAAGLHTVSGHAGFADAVSEVKQGLVRFLLAACAQGRTVVGYGAPGKGNTLLNHCGIRQDLLAYTVDRNPGKQGKFLPGTHVPIHPPERIALDRPDFVLVLPWNLRRELTEQLGGVREWGGRLVFAIPSLTIDPLDGQDAPAPEGVQASVTTGGRP